MGDLFRSLQRLEMRYEEMGGPPKLVKQPLCQLFALDQGSRYLGA